MGRQITHLFTCQWLFGRFPRRIARWMAADCSYLCLLMAFPAVRAPYCVADGTGLRVISLFNGFHDGLRTVLLRRWQRIAHTSARQPLSRRFAHHIAQWMVADSSYFRSSTPFTTVCVLYWSVDGSGLLILPLVNGFHDHCIAYSSGRLPFTRRFVCCIARRMAVCARYC